MKKTIIFYASNHGFGHLTRVMGIIEEILRVSDYKVSLVSGENQIKFAKKYLTQYSGRIEFRAQNIDVGIICYENTLDVDVQRSNDEIWKYLGNIEELTKKEAEYYRRKDIEKVVVDISILGIKVARELKVKSTLITNFTWCEQYEHFNMDKRLIKVFEDEYKSVDEIIEYDLSLGMKRYGDTTCGGLLCRKIDYKKVGEIKRKYGEILMISCGKSASLANVRVNNFDGTIIKTAGIDVKSTARIVELPLETINTQDYVAASSVLVTKAGWGTLGEGLIGHTPMILLERDVREDTEMTRILKERRLATSIDEKSLMDFDYSLWKKKVYREIDQSKLDQVEDSVEKVVDILIRK